MVAFILNESAAVEVLPHDADPQDVLRTMNEHASRLAGQIIKGDAYVLSSYASLKECNRVIGYNVPSKLAACVACSVQPGSLHDCAKSNTCAQPTSRDGHNTYCSEISSFTYAALSCASGNTSNTGSVSSSIHGNSSSAIGDIRSSSNSSQRCELHDTASSIVTSSMDLELSTANKDLPCLHHSSLPYHGPLPCTPQPRLGDQTCYPLMLQQHQHQHQQHQYQHQHVSCQQGDHVTAASSTLDYPMPPWQDLPFGILSMVTMHLMQASGCAASLAMCLTHVCRSWRKALLDDHTLLKTLYFCINPYTLCRGANILQATTPVSAFHAGTSSAAVTAPGTNSNPLLGSSMHPPSACASLACNSSEGSSSTPPTSSAINYFAQQRPLLLAWEGAPFGPPDSNSRSSCQSSTTGLRKSPNMQMLWQQLQQPPLLINAAKIGNLSAMAALAQMLEVCGSAGDAMRWWKRCAKAGDMEAQFKFGFALYEGAAGCQMDSDMAHTWLSKALKQALSIAALAEATPPPDSILYSGSGSSSSAASYSSLLNDAAAAALPSTPSSLQLPAAPCQPHAAMAGPHAALLHHGHTASQSVQQAQFEGHAAATAVQRRYRHGLRVLTARAALVLGYLYFDGEAGSQENREEACRLFKLSASLGCTDAEQVLGWIFNTGQFG